jgi:predicted phosphodiesterase
LKLNILSDLHLGFGMLDLPRNDADVVVLAGDIARPAPAVEWALGFSKPVLYVPGNHEFYGSSIPGTLDELRRLSAGTNVRVLADDEVTIDGVRFLGSTLWTDFLLQGGGERRSAAMREGQRFMRDFARIRLTDASPAPFTPADAAALFAMHSRWLDAGLREAHAGTTVVITHHAPSRRSIHRRFADSRLNACFVSDAEHLLDGRRTPLWIHGHTHDSFDYVVNGTRVVCNPRGYAKDGVNENPRFDPDLCIDIGA